MQAITKKNFNAGDLGSKKFGNGFTPQIADQRVFYPQETRVLKFLLVIRFSAYDTALMWFCLIISFRHRDVKLDEWDAWKMALN